MDNNVGFNTYLNNFKTNMINTINDSGLPVGVVYYIMKDILNDIQNAYENTLKKEKEESKRIKDTENTEQETENK